MRQEMQEPDAVKRQRELARLTNLQSLSDFARGSTSQNLRMYGSGNRVMSGSMGLASLATGG